MRKKLLGLAMAAFMFSSFGAFAQSPDASAVSQKASTEQCCKDKKKGDKKKGDKKKNKDGRNKAHKERVTPFAGINLTPEQQKQIDALRAEQLASAKADKEAKKEAMKQARILKNKEFETAVSKILTPEQFAQFKNNCDTIKALKHAYKDKDKAKKGNKAHKK